MKPWTEARDNNRYMKYHSELTYQLSFWNVSRKVDYHAGGKWLIHGPKRHKENQLISLKHPWPLLIILSIAWYQGSKYTDIYIYICIYIYTRTNYHKCPSQTTKLEIVRRKHVHLTSFGAYSSTCCKGTDNCAGTMGVDQLPSSGWL